MSPELETLLSRRALLRLGGATVTTWALAGCGGEGEGAEVDTVGASDASSGDPGTAGDLAHSDRMGDDQGATDGGGEGVAVTPPCDEPAAFSPGAYRAAVAYPEAAAAPFALGVASGDPLHDRVILWTRVIRDPTRADGGVTGETVSVAWRIATDPEITEVVNEGVVDARADEAFSVHVDADGLEADRFYWFDFEAEGARSPVGRARTLAPRGANPAGLTFAVASCQRYNSGWYGAHAHLATEDVDLVFWVGDYIYESDGQGVRRHHLPTATDLDTYRRYYAAYRSDGALQAAHARAPWIVTWDDHEVRNNHGREGAQVGLSDAEWSARRTAAYRAWWEHMPVRLPRPDGDALPIHRDFVHGDLCAFWVLDTRQFRDSYACGRTLGGSCEAAEAADRQLLGPEQEAWLLAGQRDSAARWNILAQQVVFANLVFGGGIYNFDQWDGFPAARQRIVDNWVEHGVRNPVVLTGDIHTSITAEIGAVVADPASPAVGTELVCTSISSGLSQSTATLEDVIETAIEQMPHIRTFDPTQRGYRVVHVDESSLRAEARALETSVERSTRVRTNSVFEVYDGDPRPCRLQPD